MLKCTYIMINIWTNFQFLFNFNKTLCWKLMFWKFKRINFKAFGAPLEFWLACVLMLCTHWALPISARRFRLRNPSCLTAARKIWGHRRTADSQSKQGDPPPGHSPVWVRLSWPWGQRQGQNHDNWQRHKGPGNFRKICDSWRGS